MNETKTIEKPIVKTTRKRVAKKAAKKVSKTAEQSFPRKPDGSIDWFAMIPDEFVVPQDRSFSGDVKELDERNKMVLLGGWKYLLYKRGFIDKIDTIHTSTREYVCISCKIVWKPHVESDGEIQTYTSTADAHFDNTEGLMRRFLTTNAENRALARCVRGFLRINVVGKDEIDKATIDEMVKGDPAKETKSLSGSPQKMAALKAKSMKRNFKGAREWLLKEERITQEECDKLNDWNDISDDDAFAIIGYLSNS